MNVPRYFTVAFVFGTRPVEAPLVSHNMRTALRMILDAMDANQDKQPNLVNVCELTRDQFYARYPNYDTESEG